MFPGNDFCYMTESYLFFPGERGLELATGTSEATVGDVFYCFSSTLILTLILIIFVRWSETCLDTTRDDFEHVEHVYDVGVFILDSLEFLWIISDG